MERVGAGAGWILVAMAAESSAQEANVELLRSFYALSTADLVPLLAEERGIALVRATLGRFLHPEFEFDYEGGEGALAEFSGTFTGPDALIEGWRRWLEPWRTYLVELEELDPLDDERVVAFVRVRARMRESSEEMTVAGGALWTVRDGKIRRMSMYLDRSRLLRHAGVESG
jgi:ketosteroid isomerase-like protein